MKTMTCNDLGGACDMAFHAVSFEDLAQQSKAHAMEMLMTQDLAHIEAMSKMKHLMEDPSAMQAFMDEKRKEFDALAEE
jgi:hypothetical protein